MIEPRDNALYLCMPEVTISPGCGHEDMLTNAVKHQRIIHVYECMSRLRVHGSTPQSHCSVRKCLALHGRSAAESWSQSEIGKQIDLHLALSCKLFNVNSCLLVAWKPFQSNVVFPQKRPALQHCCGTSIRVIRYCLSHAFCSYVYNAVLGSYWCRYFSQNVLRYK
jgi:hypothetical protein